MGSNPSEGTECPCSSVGRAPAKKDDPVLLCPSSPIGMRRLSQKENRVGSSPTLGTKFDHLGSFQQSY